MSDDFDIYIVVTFFGISDIQRSILICKDLETARNKYHHCLSIREHNTTYIVYGPYSLEEEIKFELNKIILSSRNKIDNNKKVVESSSWSPLPLPYK